MIVGRQKDEVFGTHKGRRPRSEGDLPYQSWAGYITNMFEFEFLTNTSVKWYLTYVK
jgi:hypothetical protein